MARRDDCSGDRCRGRDDIDFYTIIISLQEVLCVDGPTVARALGGAFDLTVGAADSLYRPIEMELDEDDDAEVYEWFYDHKPLLHTKVNRRASRATEAP